MERLPNLPERLNKIRKAVGHIIFTQPLATHGDHFNDFVPFEEDSVQPSFWDSRGYPHYPQEPKWTDMGEYLEREI